MQLFKNMFLDAIGEARDSPRRNAHQGMWHKHVLNQDTDREIEVPLFVPLPYSCVGLSPRWTDFHSSTPAQTRRASATGGVGHATHLLFSLPAHPPQVCSFLRRFVRHDMSMSMSMSMSMPMSMTMSMLQVFLLDERYDREPKPCYVRQEYCENVRVESSRVVGKRCSRSSCRTNE